MFLIFLYIHLDCLDWIYSSRKYWMLSCIIRSRPMVRFLICNRVLGAIFKVKNPSICHSKLYEFPNAPKLSKTIGTFKDLLLFLGKWSVFTSIHVSNRWCNYQLEKNSWWLMYQRIKFLALGIGFMVWKYDEHRGLLVFSFIASMVRSLMNTWPSRCFTNHIGDSSPSNTLEWRFVEMCCVYNS